MVAKYRVVCFMRIEADEVEPMTLAQAEKEAESQRGMQPEDIFVVEQVEEVPMD